MKPLHLSTQAIGMACGCDSCSKPAGHEKEADLARRGFLCSAVAGTVAVLAGAQSCPFGPHRPKAH